MADAEAIRAIYNHEVTTATARSTSCPARSPSSSEWLPPLRGVQRRSSPSDGEVVGFASLSPYKERAAYRTTVEDSVYVRRDRHGEGIGTALLALLDVAEPAGSTP